ncbi:MAG: phosphoribosylanthranilate isomerase [Lachnospiraceae bacterium]|nr:phosphoribosylanthranilate isomerase [Lachnospiraceae bacterium]
MSVQVKICGLSRPEDIRAVNDLKPDYAGFVFYKKSKRNIRFMTAHKLLGLLDPQIKSVAVCVSPTMEFIRELSGFGFDRIQIHGEISPEILDQIQTPVWQAVNLKNIPHSGGTSPAVRHAAELGALQPGGIVDLICRHSNICGYVIDGADYGGGKTFGWEEDGALGNSAADSIRDALDGQKFILAGGLNAENVQTGIRLFRPDVVDVSSGVESGNHKDRTLMEKFISKARER